MNIKRGELLRINLNPTTGREQQGKARPCLVISHTLYNKSRKGLVIVMPITSTIKPEIKTMIPLPSSCNFSGSVIVEQIRTLDLNKRWFQKTGTILPENFVEQVVATFNLLII